jgi:AcrR family transcriptional regulator
MAPDARAAVLDHAGRLFDRRGFEAVSIADLTAASGVSNGSIYHHFGSKDGVLAALVVTALERYQQGILATFAAHADDAEGGIRAAVASELRWFEDDPRDARLVVAHRDRIAASPAGRDALRAANRTFLRAVRAWLARHDATKDINFEVVHAVVFAPARQLASLWLAQRIRPRPTTYAPALQAAAWAALQGARTS